MSADSQQQQQHRNQTTPPLPQEQSYDGALNSIITSVLAKKMPKNLKKKKVDVCSQMLPDGVLAQHLKYLLTHQQYSPARQTFLFFNGKIKY